MCKIRVGKEKITFEDEYDFNEGADMRNYCDKRLSSENRQKTIDTDKKILLAIKLYVENTIGLDFNDVYNLVFEGKDYYDIEYFTIDDLDLYKEFLYNDGDCDDYIYPISDFDEIVLADKSPSECLELGFDIDENEYRRAEYFRNSYYEGLEFFDRDDIENEMCNDNDFRNWLRKCDYYYEIQDEIDGITENWKEEYEVEL